jgi:hypothetical protein
MEGTQRLNVQYTTLIGVHSDFLTLLSDFLTLHSDILTSVLLNGKVLMCVGGLPSMLCFQIISCRFEIRKTVNSEDQLIGLLANRAPRYHEVGRQLRVGT